MSLKSLVENRISEIRRNTRLPMAWVDALKNRYPAGIHILAMLNGAK